jgi:hypothetical protein
MNITGIEIGEVTARVASSDGRMTQLVANLGHRFETPASCLVSSDGTLAAGFIPSRRPKSSEELIERILLRPERPECAVALLHKLAEVAEIKTGSKAAQVVLALPDWLHGEWSGRFENDPAGPIEHLTIAPRSAAALARLDGDAVGVVATLDISESRAAYGNVSIGGGLKIDAPAECGPGASDLAAAAARRIFEQHASDSGAAGHLTPASAATLEARTMDILRILARDPRTEIAAPNLALDDGTRFDLDRDVDRRQVEDIIEQYARDWAARFAEHLAAAGIRPALVVVTSVIGPWPCVREAIAAVTDCRVVVGTSEEAALGACLLPGLMEAAESRVAEAPAAPSPVVEKEPAPAPEAPETKADEIPEAGTPSDDADMQPPEPGPEPEEPTPVPDALEPEAPPVVEEEPVAAPASSQASPEGPEHEEKPPDQEQAEDEPIAAEQAPAVTYVPVREPTPHGLGFVTIATRSDTGDTVRMVELPYARLGREQVHQVIERIGLAAEIHDPLVAPILETTEGDESAVYVEGNGSWPTLRDVLGQRSPLPPAEIVRIGEGLARALGLLRALGIFHRNIKPENILVADGGQSICIRGFEHAVRVPVGKKVASIAGTLQYVAPETFKGAADCRADMYAAGVVLFEALTGRLPFAADTPQALAKLVVSGERLLPSSLNPAAPSELDDLVLAALATDPDARRLDPESFRAIAQQPTE